MKIRYKHYLRIAYGAVQVLRKANFEHYLPSLYYTEAGHGAGGQSVTDIDISYLYFHFFALVSKQSTALSSAT